MSFIDIFHNTPADQRVRIGHGTTRVVYIVPGAPGIVFKKPHGDYDRKYNLCEYAVWQYLKGDPEKANWCAPVLECLPDGEVLAMIQTTPIYRSEVTVRWAEIPNWIDDKVESNFSLLDNNIVCHDYAHHRIYGVAKPRDFP